MQNLYRESLCDTCCKYITRQQIYCLYGQHPVAVRCTIYSFKFLNRHIPNCANKLRTAPTWQQLEKVKFKNLVFTPISYSQYKLHGLMWQYVQVVVSITVEIFLAKMIFTFSCAYYRVSQFHGGRVKPRSFLFPRNFPHSEKRWFFIKVRSSIIILLQFFLEVYKFGIKESFLYILLFLFR